MMVRMQTLGARHLSIFVCGLRRNGHPALTTAAAVRMPIIILLWLNV